MRVYARDQACGFRYTKAAWGAFSNFQPLAVPIVAGPWTLVTAEHVYHACVSIPPTPTSNSASHKRPRRGKRPLSAARQVSASTPTGTRSASTSCPGCCA